MILCTRTTLCWVSMWFTVGIILVISFRVTSLIVIRLYRGQWSKPEDHWKIIQINSTKTKLSQRQNTAHQAVCILYGYTRYFVSSIRVLLPHEHFIKYLLKAGTKELGQVITSYSYCGMLITCPCRWYQLSQMPLCHRVPFSIYGWARSHPIGEGVTYVTSSLVGWKHA